MTTDNCTLLYQNRRKETEKHPDFLGELVVNNITYNAAAWLSTTKKGQPCICLKLSTKQGPQSVQLSYWLWHRKGTAVFKTREELDAIPHLIEARIQEPDPAGLIHLVVNIQPDKTTEESPNTRQLSPAARATEHQLKELLAAAQPELPAAKQNSSEQSSEEEIPF